MIKRLAHYCGKVTKIIETVVEFDTGCDRRALDDLLADPYPAEGGIGMTAVAEKQTVPSLRSG